MKLTAIRVYTILASNRQKNGQAWCSLGRIGRALGVKESNVSRALKELQNAGYLVKLHPGGGRKKSTLYDIVPPEKLIPWDNLSGLEDAPSEAKNFVHGIISGDNKTPSLEITKYRQKRDTPPLPPPSGGDADGPNGPTHGRSLDGACGAGRSENAAPKGATSVDEGACGADQSGRGDRSEIFSAPPLTENKSEAYARERIADAIGYQNGAALILIAADDPNDPNHHDAARTVQATADRIGVRWGGPRHA